MTVKVLIVGKLLMVILQFQFTDLQEEERQLIPDFCDWLKMFMFNKLYSKMNMRKIGLRLEYIENNDLPWISWKPNKKYDTTVMDLIENIIDSIIATPHKNNVWKLETDNVTVIPNSYTLIEKFIRFVNYGDNKCKATGIFTNMEQEYRHQKLNALWKHYVLKEYGYIPDSIIVTV